MGQVDPGHAASDIQVGDSGCYGSHRARHGTASNCYKARPAQHDHVREQLEPWHRYHITENINEFLENAKSLQGTAEYQRLLTALRERDMIPESPAEDE